VSTIREGSSVGFDSDSFTLSLSRLLSHPCSLTPGQTEMVGVLMSPSPDELLLWLLCLCLLGCPRGQSSGKSTRIVRLKRLDSVRSRSDIRPRPNKVSDTSLRAEHAKH
jgi:hypothetical protein